MPKVPKLGHLPKHHAIHGTAEEKSERALRQAYDENREFYEEGARYAREVSLIQTGINERVARLLTRNFVDNSAEEGPVSPELATVREERIKSELYRAVQGNELYETERGEDSKHYLGSANVDHMTSGIGKRAVNQVKNVARGAVKMAGGNNYIEAKSDDRFGKSGDLFALRNETLANTLDGVLESIAQGDPLLWQNLQQRLGAQTPQAMREKLAKMSIGKLQDFDHWLTAAGLDRLYHNAAYRRMLTPIEFDMALGRKLYVAMRLRPTLEQLLHGGSPALLQMLMTEVGITPDPNNLQAQILDLIETLAGLRLSDLRRIRDNANFAPIVHNPVFQDLMLLADVEQRESSKMGIDEIYDHETLRKFWHDLHKAEGPEAELASLVEDMLEPNSLFPLESNVEGKALLAEIRARIQHVSGSPEKLIKELKDIRTQELPNSELDEATKTKIDSARKELMELADDSRDQLGQLLTARRDLFRLNGEITKEEESLKAYVAVMKAKLERDKAYAQSQVDQSNEAIKNAGNGINVNRNNGLVQSRDKWADKVLDIENKIADLDPVTGRGIYADVLDERRKGLNDLETKRTEVRNALDATQDKARDAARKIQTASAKKLVASHWHETDDLVAFMSNTDFLHVDKEQEFEAMNQLINQKRSAGNIVFNKLYGEIVEIKTTPFIMLQRLMRRDYYKGRGLDPAVFNKKFNEEANHYALLKAGLRVQDVKNVDLMRSSNDKAAKYMRSGFHNRGWDKLKHVVAKGQNFLGLEPFEIQNISEDMLIQQIVDSEPEFAVFQGVNKFTTTRDLRDILHKSGQEVSTETFERFAAVLEEAITKFKKVPPSLYKGLRMIDWDLENLIIVLQKMKVEQWSRQFLSKVEKTGGDGEREKILIGMLKQSRAEEQKIAASIAADVKHPDAMWRKYLVKSELKRILDQEEVESMNKVKAAGIDYKKKQMQKVQAELNTLPDGSPDRLRMTKEVENLKQEIGVVEKQIANSKDLYEKVETARAYIRDNDLSRRERKEYLKEMGLTQVFDKMSTNFRLQRAWHYTKKGAAAMWSGTKKTWAWSRRKFLNSATAKKAFSLGRIAATPITWPLSKAWKYGTWPIRLTGRALRRATHMPKRFTGLFSKRMMRSYLRDRVVQIEDQIASISAKQAKLRAKVGRVPYTWDKNRLRKQIDELEEKKMDLAEDIADYRKSAADKKIDIGALYKIPGANDNDSLDKAA